MLNLKLTVFAICLMFLTTHGTVIENEIERDGEKYLLSASVHAFMYLWYGEPNTDGMYKHWNHEVLPHWEDRVNQGFPQIGNRFNPPYDVHSPYYPLNGPYSSRDTKVMHRQFDELLSGGIDVAVVSWWGQKDKPHATDTQGVNTDEIMATLLEQADIYNAMPEHAKHIKIAFHLEPYPSRSVTSVKEDIEYIAENYGHHQCLYRASDGRLVYYVYDSYHILPLQWARMLGPDGDLTVRGAAADGVFLGLWLHHHHGRDIKYGNFDGFYTYFGTDGFSYGSTSHNWPNMCRFAKKQDPPMISSISVGPGYNDSLIRPWNSHNERGRNSGKYYENMWNQAIKAKPNLISITSYNEWGEGTQIEPARSFTLIQDHIGSGNKEDTYDGMQRRQMGVSADQLREGVNMEDLTKDLEDLGSSSTLQDLHLYTTPYAEVAIGSKAAGLRTDSDLPGVGRATQRFSGEAFYDEGDSDGDGVADSGGDMLDFHVDNENNKKEAQNDERKHITTKKLEELEKQKQLLAELKKEHEKGILFNSDNWDVLRGRGYGDYGRELGPNGYLRKTAEYGEKFRQHKVEEGSGPSFKSEM